MDVTMSSILLNGHSLPVSVPSAGSEPAVHAPQVSSVESPAASPSQATPVSTPIPNPQLTQKAKRRSFTGAYKRRIIEEADECVGRGELTILLRREGLYSSTLANFRRQEAEGLLEPRSTRKPKASKDPEVQAMLAQRAELERDNRNLRRKLAHAEKIIAIQKKAAFLLGETLQEINLDDED